MTAPPSHRSVPSRPPAPEKPRSVKSRIVGPFFGLLLLVLGLGGFLALLGVMRRVIMWGWQ